MSTLQTDTAVLQQNYAHAPRMLVGLPPYAPTCDAVGFMIGKPIYMQASAEIARVAQEVGKDVVHVSFASATARKPSDFTIAWRELYHVEVITNCALYVGSPNAPLMLVSTSSAACFKLDSRGTLVRMGDKPADLARSKRLAMKLIKSTAESLGNTQLADKQPITRGAVPFQPPRQAPLVLFS